MKAYAISQFGGPEVFEEIEVQKPAVKPGHVLVEVAASSVNQLDIKMRSGAVPNITPTFPAILHGDVSGVIVEKANDVEHFDVGDEVYGIAGGIADLPGALADYMLIDANLIAKKPENLSLEEAAAVPLVGITAMVALEKKITLKEDQVILVHGGVGSVGHIGVQLAKIAGTTVATTVSDDKDFKLAKQLGADFCINFKKESVNQYVSRITHGEGFEVIFDTVGGLNLANSFAAAANSADIVTTVARVTQDLTPMHNKGLNLYVVFMMLPLITHKGREGYRPMLERLARLIDDLKIKILLDKHRFKFKDITKAHVYVESGNARGKVLLIR